MLNFEENLKRSFYYGEEYFKTFKMKNSHPFGYNLMILYERYKEMLKIIFLQEKKN